MFRTPRWKSASAALAALLLTVGHLAAQTTGSVSSTLLEEALSAESPTADAGIDKINPLEAPIDPTTYRVGPNDLFILSLPNINDLRVPVQIGADNMLVLPRGLPAIDVGGMTLSELRRRVQQLYLERSSSYRNVALALQRPRPIRVRVSGDVLVPGSYDLTAADRVSTAIDVANTIGEKLPAEQRKALVQERLSRRAAQPGGGARQTTLDLPLRSVTLRHNDGTATEVDLLRYRALGDLGSNPTLREGDEVIVHEPDARRRTVAIQGAVGSPQVLPWRQGDNALLLIRSGAGIRAGDGAEVILYSSSSGTITTRRLDLTDTMELAATILSPSDRIVVIPPASATTGGGGVGTVLVEGEVARPGAYPIIPGRTTLSEVMELAGGPTADAALNGAYVAREDPYMADVASAARRDPAATLSATSLTLDDTTRLVADLTQQLNRVSVDVEAVVRGDRSRDVALESGDRVVVPTNPKTVQVLGRVRLAGAVRYVAGADLQYYIDQAGGYIEAAAEDRVQVFKFGTAVAVAPRPGAIGPGDQIYVPGERDTPARTALEEASTIIQITAALVGIGNVLYFLVRELTKE